MVVAGQNDGEHYPETDLQTIEVSRETASYLSDPGGNRDKRGIVRDVQKQLEDSETHPHMRQKRLNSYQPWEKLSG